MNILVLNGSPKGKYSITLHTVLYLEKCFPNHSFEILNVGQRIKSLEKDFTPAKEAISHSDLLLFAYPVYTFMAPSQLHRFIELLKEAKVDLTGKYAAQISTSKHFYDVTAHRYIQDNCQDLKLKYIDGLSADMDDILKPQGQKEAEDFFNYLCWSINKDSYKPYSSPIDEFIPVPATPVSGCDTDKNGDVVIVTDCRDTDVNLKAMIDRFRALLPCKTRIVNLHEYPFSGGCLGCFHCAVSGKCIYKDGFDDFLRSTIQTAAATVYAFTIKDHSMGARFKMYDDRQFCNGHRTVTMGSPVGYLISGAYSTEFNLQTVVEARAQVGHNFLAGVATDEENTDRAIEKMAQRLSYAIEHSYTPPQNFYGIGGMKIFRDLIWLMQGMMKADHKFYKANGQYDFPQKNRGTMLKMYLVGALLSSPAIMAKTGNKLNEGMIAPYKKLIEKM